MRSASSSARVQRSDAAGPPIVAQASSRRASRSATHGASASVFVAGFESANGPGARVGWTAGVICDAEALGALGAADAFGAADDVGAAVTAGPGDDPSDDGGADDDDTDAEDVASGDGATIDAPPVVSAPGVVTTARGTPRGAARSAAVATRPTSEDRTRKANRIDAMGAPMAPRGRPRLSRQRGQKPETRRVT